MKCVLLLVVLIALLRSAEAGPLTAFLNAAPVTLVTGSQDIGPFTIADTANDIELRIKRSTTLTPTLWANASTTLQMSIYLSYDGGQTWQFQSGTGSQPMAGGIVVNGLGGEAPDVFLHLTGLKAGVNRRVKAIATVVNGPLVTEATFTAQ